MEEKLCCRTEAGQRSHSISHWGRNRNSWVTANNNKKMIIVLDSHNKWQMKNILTNNVHSFNANDGYILNDLIEWLFFFASIYNPISRYQVLSTEISTVCSSIYAVWQGYGERDTSLSLLPINTSDISCNESERLLCKQSQVRGIGIFIQIFSPLPCDVNTLNCHK